MKMDALIVYMNMKKYIGIVISVLCGMACLATALYFGYLLLLGQNLSFLNVIEIVMAALPVLVLYLLPILLIRAGVGKRLAILHGILLPVFIAFTVYAPFSMQGGTTSFPRWVVLYGLYPFVVPLAVFDGIYLLRRAGSRRAVSRAV